jgi:exonuclease SbcD
MSFSEANDTKKVNLVTFESHGLRVAPLEIPSFQKLVTLRGKQESIMKSLESLQDTQAWVEVELDDENPLVANVAIRKYAQELGVKILLLRVTKGEGAFDAEVFEEKTLDQLTPQEVFSLRLEQEKLEDERLKKALNREFLKVLEGVQLR